MAYTSAEAVWKEGMGRKAVSDMARMVREEDAL